MKIFITAVILLFCSQLGAQQQQYFILLIKGDVLVKQQGYPLKKAKVLQKLSLNDSIYLNNDQSNITIANTSGSRTELKGKGKYRITEIQIKENSKGPGATSKFFAFLYEELLHPKKGFNQQSIAASWGGGSRASVESVKWPINGLVSSGDSILFKWRHKNKMLNYNFILYDNSMNEIFNCNVRDTQLVIKTINLRVRDKIRYFWSIKSVSESTLTLSKYHFELVSKEEEERMTDSIIKEIPINEQEILYHLEIADKLGRNGLVDKALEYFEQAFNRIKKRD